MPSTMRPVVLRILVVLMTFTLVLGAACSPRQQVPAPQGPVQARPAGESGAALEPTAVSPAVDPADRGAGEEAAEVRFQEEGYEAARYPALPLGAVAFVADPARSVEQQIIPGEGTANMQVVDGAGATWSLEIPAGALASPQVVKMTPLSELEGRTNEPIGDLVSGVRLEPDGLAFLKPVRLSVSSEAQRGTAIILAGSQAGDEIDYALQDLAAEQPTARLLHFSTYFTSEFEEQDLAEFQNKAWKEYQRLAAEAQNLLKKPLDMPTPPSISLECTDEETGEENSEDIRAFVENAQNPESDLIGRLLTQRTILALTGDGEMGNLDESDLEPALVRRLGRKAIAMLEKYQGQEEKLLAVSAFAIDTARQLELLNADPGVSAEILNSLAAWNRQLIDGLIKDIRENHNYWRIPVVWTIAYNASVLGDIDIMERFLEDLKNALRFEVQVHFEVNMPDLNTITESVVPVQFEPENGLLYTCLGEGTGTYLQAEIDIEDITVAVSPFPVHVMVKDFDPCSGTVTIGVDRFGSDSDTMTAITDESSDTYPWTISRDAGEGLFSEEEADEMFWFVLPIENESATAVDETIDRTKHEIVHGELAIKLIHK